LTANIVFVVDDEKAIADTLAMILRIRGYEVTAFYNAETALAGCEGVVPGFIISDVFMPGMSGVEMIIKIEARYPACKFLLISGNAETSDVLAAVRLKGYDFPVLAKPFHPNDLLAKLDTLGFKNGEPARPSADNSLS
jgi:DNA-binding NtrC family response regulator